jgi:hypothetical protein
LIARFRDGNHHMADNDRQFHEGPGSKDQSGGIDMSVSVIQECFGMVWQLTIEEYAKKSIDIINQPMRKDITRLTHLKDQ